MVERFWGRRKMKIHRIPNAILSTILSLAILTASPAFVGCANWIENFKKDPVGQIQVIIQEVMSVVSVATFVFGQVKPNLPQDEQAKAQAEWDKAMLEVHTSMAALQAGLKVAMDAKQEHPDLGKLIDDVFAATTALKKVIDGAQSAPGSRMAMGKPVAGYDMLEKHMAVLKQSLPSAKASLAH